MLRDGMEETLTDIEPVLTWARGNQREDAPDWRTVDRALRAIRQRRATLDAEEARWLREAEALEIWRPLGMVSALDYLERVLGYAPRTAQERLRVARALGALPQLTSALAAGELPYSAVRELTRVATPVTEASWIAASTGKNLRQIEELVADHRPGDGPDDPPDPEARTHVVRYELSAESFALLRQTRMVLDDEHGKNLADDAFIAALCGAVLEGASKAEPTGRAKFQIAVTVCQRCRQGWQEGAGAQIAIGPAAVDRAMCDAQHIGSIDGPAPERAYQDIPPNVARFVWRRDGGRCRVDGCRSSRGLELHHLVHRADGGSHDASNLILACSSCHQSHHAGVLTISGTADHLEVRRPDRTTRLGDVAGFPAEATVSARFGAPPRATDVMTSGSHGRAHEGVASVMAPIEHPDARMGRPGVTTSIARAGAHVDAANERTSDSGAHVDAVDETTSDSHAHVDAVDETTSDSHAHVDVASAVASIEHPSAHVGAPSKLDTAILRTQAKAALTGLGWKPAIAHAAVAAAAAAQGPDVTLERLIFESLRRCPIPKA